jgi:SAM-dependent methyltransferase
MNCFLHGVARAVAESFPLPGPILEIGSYQVAGQEAIGDLRSLFPGRDYLGLDMRPGPGVDLVGNVEALDLPDASVGTVLAFSTFEHVKHFWRGFDEVRRVLRPDGVFVLSVPFNLHLHGYPSDYWRFTAEALEVLLADHYPSRLLGQQGPKTKPHNVWAVAFRSRTAPDQLTTFRERLKLHAHEPMPWTRRLRYWLGRLVAGRRPFTPWFDRDRWSIEWKETPTYEQVPCKRSSFADASAGGLGLHRQLELPGATAPLPALTGTSASAAASGDPGRR